MGFHKIAVPLVCLVLLLNCSNAAKISEGAKSSRHLADAAEGYSYKDALGRKSTINNDADNCPEILKDDQDLINEIAGYQDVANNIINEVTNGRFKGQTYDELADFVDKFPIRQSGFQNLEDSIDHIMAKMTNDFALDEVRDEQVLVPHWVRGEESATMIEPHQKTIRLLGLGTSVGTPEEGITGEVLVVKSFEDLNDKKDEARGKIVVYNQGWLGSYGATNVYRTRGASHASQYGAIATLIQSVAPFSLDTPHTGGQTYWDNVTHIPTACITMEDADTMYRLQQKGQTIKVHLKMLHYNLPLTTSRNAIGELRGRELENEFVAVTGHIDSWDLGHGAMDDAGGVMISVMALRVLKALGLQPRRTLQAILWTSEEVGLWGVDDFAKQHLDILPNYSVVFESDSGTFQPLGLDFAGSERAGCIVNEVLKLTASINTTAYARYDSVSSDITRLIAEGVPGLSLNNANDRYFWYHHTEADTITMMDTTELDYNTALWALTSYVLSDLSIKLPRDPPSTP